MNDELKPFDPADYLDDDEVIAEYLTAAAESDDPTRFISALSDVARARGIARVAETSGLGRESLYKALAPGAHPRHETIARVIRSLGLRMTISTERRAS
jgi:probable addiction module antidote protein